MSSASSTAWRCTSSAISRIPATCASSDARPPMTVGELAVGVRRISTMSASSSLIAAANDCTCASMSDSAACESSAWRMSSSSRAILAWASAISTERPSMVFSNAMSRPGCDSALRYAPALSRSARNGSSATWPASTSPRNVVTFSSRRACVREVLVFNHGRLTLPSSNASASCFGSSSVYALPFTVGTNVCSVSNMPDPCKFCRRPISLRRT